MGVLNQSGKATDPSDYLQESSVGTEVLLYNISKYSQENDLKNLKMIGYYASPLEQLEKSKLHLPECLKLVLLTVMFTSEL